MLHSVCVAGMRKALIVNAIAVSVCKRRNQLAMLTGVNNPKA